MIIKLRKVLNMQSQITLLRTSTQRITFVAHCYLVYTPIFSKNVTSRVHFTPFLQGM
jgi:hypothetical protein